MPRGFLILITIFIMLYSVLACNFKKEPLSVGFHNWAPYQMLCIANKEGLFENVRINKTSSATKTMELLKQKKLDAGALTLDEAIKLIDEGVDLVVILVFDISAGADMIVAKEDIRYPPQLIGKKIAVEYSGLGALMLSKFLEIYKISDNDIQKVISPVDQHLELWMNNEIDAAITFPPFADKMLELGGRLIFDSREIPNTIIDVLVVRKDVMEKKHSQIHNLIKGYLKVFDNFVYNSEHFYYEIASCMEVDVEGVKKSFEKLNIPNINKNKTLLSEDGDVLKVAKYLADHLKQWKIIKEVKITNSLVSDKYIPVSR